MGSKEVVVRYTRVSNDYCVANSSNAVATTDEGARRSDSLLCLADLHSQPSLAAKPRRRNLDKKTINITINTNAHNTRASINTQKEITVVNSRTYKNMN